MSTFYSLKYFAKKFFTGKYFTNVEDVGAVAAKITLVPRGIEAIVDTGISALSMSVSGTEAISEVSPSTFIEFVVSGIGQIPDGTTQSGTVIIHLDATGIQQVIGGAPVQPRIVLPTSDVGAGHTRSLLEQVNRLPSREEMAHARRREEDELVLLDLL